MVLQTSMEPYLIVHAITNIGAHGSVDYVFYESNRTKLAAGNRVIGIACTGVNRLPIPTTLGVTPNAGLARRGLELHATQ